MKLYWRYKKNGKWSWKPAKVGGRWLEPMTQKASRRWGFFVQEEEE